MNKHQFETLCKRVLLPIIQTAMKKELESVHEVLDIFARELAKLDKQLDRMESASKAAYRRKPRG